MSRKIDTVKYYRTITRRQNIPPLYNITTYFSLDLQNTICIITWHAGLAQLVEHLICNQRVVGSSPTTGTR